MSMHLQSREGRGGHQRPVGLGHAHEARRLLLGRGQVQPRGPAEAQVGERDDRGQGLLGIQEGHEVQCESLNFLAGNCFVVGTSVARWSRPISTNGSTIYSYISSNKQS